MGSTSTILLYHLVFSTKDRYAFIQESWSEQLNAYLGGCVRDRHGVADAIGGSSDHRHMLLSLKTIKNQAAHHRRRTFQEEYLDFLNKNGIEYDER